MLYESVMDVLAIFSVFFLSLLLAMAGASAGLKAALCLIARVPPALPARHDRREFLDPFPAVDFARVDVSPRIDADRVREVELPR